MAGIDRGRALLDHFGGIGARRPRQPEAPPRRSLAASTPLDWRRCPGPHRRPRLDASAMPPATSFAGQSCAVVGLGRSGLAAARALLAGGGRAVAWDDDAMSRTAAAAAAIPIEGLAASDWSRFSALVLAPGIPLTHPEPHWSVRQARAAGLPIIGDIELFCRERDRIGGTTPFIAITGTNGKSTT